jgi:murein DD-endopeptidase MepM/ murein hydrolase activator NlpD
MSEAPKQSHKKRSTWLWIAAALAAAVFLAYYYPTRHASLAQTADTETSLVSQKTLGMAAQPHEVLKLYYKGELIGVVSDPQVLEDARQRAYEKYYAEDFPQSQIDFDDDIYSYSEKTYLLYEDQDAAIADYLVDNDLFLVNAYKVSIGDVDTIYVRDIDEFRSALENFVLCFVDSGTFQKLKRGDEIPSLTSYGTQDVSVYIEEKLSYSESRASSEEILKNEAEILSYLCYGRDPQMQYYTVQPYDTVDGVAAKTGLTPEKLIIINSQLTSRDQALASGMELNITYFSSPIHVVVERENYISEVIYQPETQYVIDSSLPAGEVIVTQEGGNGHQDTLYAEIYVNGELTSYKQKSSHVVEEAKPRIITVGSKSWHRDTGDLVFRLPIDNAHITCDYYCYAGHSGVDFQNPYDPWGKIYACEDGVIITNSYNSLAGWHYEINHGNGYVLRYSHMVRQGFLPVGAAVTKGEYIGDVGMTGYATGPHVHVAVEINGVQVDPCTVLPCELAY